MGGRCDEPLQPNLIDEEEEKDLPVATEHQMQQRLHARVALHLAVGQYITG